jgi:hypothetical protein
MNPNAEQAELLSQELYVWLERNNLWEGTVWRTADEHYGDAHRCNRDAAWNLV